MAYDSKISFFRYNTGMKLKFFTPLQIILTVAGVTVIRTFLENFSNPEPMGGFTSFALLVNYFLYYLIMVLSLGIMLGVLSKQSWMKMISRVTYFLPIIWIVPILDMTFSGGACLSYISSSGWSLVRDIVTFFTGPLVRCGISIGLRVEIALISLSLGVYLYKKTRLWWKGVLGAILAFLIVIFHSAIPGLILTIVGTDLPAQIYFQDLFMKSLMGTIHTLGNDVGIVRYIEQIAFFMGRIPWIMIAIVTPIIFWKESPEKFKAWIGNARATRVVYYAVILFAGTALAIGRFGGTIPHTFPDVLGYVIALICVGLSCWLGVVINDLVDQDLDAINAQDRPLVQKTLSPADMQTIGWVIGILIVTGAVLISWNFFVLVVVWQIAYAIYSLPPLQMKRHWIFSSFLVGVAGTSFALAGYFLVASHQSFASISFVYVAMIWFTLAIMSNTKDFKDVPGDRALGIKTLPATYGTRRAGIYLTATLLLWICLVSIILRNEWLVLLALPWVIIDVILRKRIPEYIRFIIVYIQIILLVVFLLV